MYGIFTYIRWNMATFKEKCRQIFPSHGASGSYCWWTKSCTTKDDDSPIIYKVLTIPGGAGFLPSTVLYMIFWSNQQLPWFTWLQRKKLRSYHIPTLGRPIWLLVLGDKIGCDNLSVCLNPYRSVWGGSSLVCRFVKTKLQGNLLYTPLKFHMEPEKKSLEKEILLETIIFRFHVKFRGSNSKFTHILKQIRFRPLEDLDLMMKKYEGLLFSSPPVPGWRHGTSPECWDMPKEYTILSRCTPSMPAWQAGSFQAMAFLEVILVIGHSPLLLHQPGFSRNYPGAYPKSKLPATLSFKRDLACLLAPLKPRTLPSKLGRWRLSWAFRREILIG